MRIPSVGDLDGEPKSKLPRRDWILLPLLSLLTIFCILLGVELSARELFTESRPFLVSCMGPEDPSTGALAFPNSVCWDKKYESPWVEYRFNDCGHRTAIDCRSAPTGVYRIVMTGSSVAMGHLVQQERTLAELLPINLSRRTNRKVELYNEGMVSIYPYVLALRFHEVVTAKPDVVLWILTPGDIVKELIIPEAFKALGDSPISKAKARFAEAFSSTPSFDVISNLWTRARGRVYRAASETAFGTMLLHCLYASESQYVKSFLAGSDPDIGYVRVHQSEEWRNRLSHFDRDFATIQSQAKAAGIPLLTVLVPNRAQAAMISVGHWPDDVDPYILNRELRDIVVTHGGTYLDIFSNFQHIPNPGEYYFPLDGHPNAAGHALLANMLARSLTSGAVPPELRVRGKSPAEEQIRR